MAKERITMYELMLREQKSSKFSSTDFFLSTRSEKKTTIQFIISNKMADSVTRDIQNMLSYMVDMISEEALDGKKQRTAEQK